MESTPFPQALRHLDEAVSRLERVARVVTPDARLAALEERHQRLREGATEALDRLDRLIGSAAPALPDNA